MKKLLQILAKKQHYLYDDLITVKPSISSTTNTVTVKYRKIHKNILPQFHPLRPSILSQMKRNKETKGCKDWIICREKLLFSRCHLNRKDLQIYGNRLGVSYIFEGRISRVVLADAIFHSPFLHSTATPEVRGSIVAASETETERGKTGSRKWWRSTFDFPFPMLCVQLPKTKHVYRPLFLLANKPIGDRWRNGKGICHANEPPRITMLLFVLILRRDL